jgi:hypothetical protein
VKLERATPRTRPPRLGVAPRGLFVLPGIVVAISIAIATVIVGVHT